jgi:hypothetical protein
MHVPNEVKVQRFGYQLVSLKDKISHTPKQPLMAGENKYDGTGYPFKKLLTEEDLMQQRNKMMDNFVQTLR